MKHPLNEGMERRANEIKTEQVPQQVPLNAENAARIIGNFLGSQLQNGKWHGEMSTCLGYLHAHAQANEDYIAATNQE